MFKKSEGIGIWVLWLKSLTTTVIFILLFLEVLIVSNEALKVMGEDSFSVCCVDGSVKINYGSKEIQIGPSIYDLRRFAEFFVDRVAILVPPFNLICLTDKLISYLGIN